MSEAQSLPSIEDVASKILSPAEASQTEAEAPEAVSEATPAEAPAPVEPPKEDKFSSRFAALSRKEKELRRREQETKQRFDDMEARLAEFKAKEERWNSIQKNPLEALKAAGVSYSDLTAQILGQKEEVPEDPIESRFKAFEERLKKADQVEEELNRIKVQAANEKVEAGERALRENFVNTIAENDEKYQLCSSMGQEAVDLAREIVGQYFEKHNEVLTYTEVLDMVESHYEEQVLKKLLSTKKAKELAGSLNKPAISETAKSVPAKAAKAATTLTNASKARIDTTNVDALPKTQAIDHLLKKYMNK